MACADGVISNAGFGTTSEALYLGKKLLVIPMKTQYEQQCNASSLEEMGVTVVKKLKKRYLEAFQYWIQTGEAISVDYPDNAAAIVEAIVSQHTNEIKDSEVAINKKAFKHIFNQI
jgi:UDP-N-acetylglucosamine:LPS N-acetylglucosamine transferase